MSKLNTLKKNEPQKKTNPTQQFDDRNSDRMSLDAKLNNRGGATNQHLRSTTSSQENAKYAYQCYVDRVFSKKD